MSDLRSTHRLKHLEEKIFEVKGESASAHLCLVRGCRKAAVSNKLSLCHCHHQARWRKRSRPSSAFATLRDHCKTRNIPFEISQEYFEGLCDAVGYFELTGGEGMHATIDRIEADKGYVPRNIRVVTRSENSAKSNKERWLPEHVQEMIRRRRDELQARLEKQDRKLNPHLYAEDPF